MKVLLSSKSLVFKNRPACIATFGIFDGLHKGHIYILNKIKKEAKKNHLKSLVVSFSPHPACFYNKDFGGYITTQEEKIHILRQMFWDYIWIIKFNKKISVMKGEVFLNYVLKSFDIKKILVGEDFKFGHKAQNTITDLGKICNKKGIQLSKIKKHRINNKVVSSSLVRRMIKKSNFKAVKVFLGRPYSIRGYIRKGKNIGTKTLKTPTINLDTDRKVLPAAGVYITKTKYKNKWYRSISNLGFAPTFKKKKLILETHIFGFKKTIYKDVVEIVFLKRLRPEKKFRHHNSLLKQIHKDFRITKKFFSSHNILYLP